MRKLKFIFAFAVCIAMTMSVTAQKNLLKTLRDNTIFAKKDNVEEKFPEALKSDPELEQIMIDALLNSRNYKEGRWDIDEVLKVSIYDSDWMLRRHEMSGIVTERYIRAAIAVKGKDGKCGFIRATFQQDYVGNKYEPVKYDGGTNRFIVECESLE